MALVHKLYCVFLGGGGKLSKFSHFFIFLLNSITLVKENEKKKKSEKKIGILFF
jgi:hypothetical protein